MKHIYLLVFAAIILLAGCSSDDKTSVSDDQMDDASEGLLLKSVYRDGELFDYYEYDSEQRVSKRIPTVGSGSIYFLYEYVGDNSILRIYDVTERLLLTDTYYRINATSYRSDRVYEPIAPNQDSYFIVNHTPEGCGINSRLGYYIDGSEYYSQIFEYNGIQCNDTEVATYINDVVIKYVRIRDEGKFAFASTYIRETNISPKHNILSETRYNENDEVEETASFTSIFEYNDLDYPITEVRTFLNGSVQNYTYEYY